MRIAIFDLDYTVWQPEMYQLWSTPKLMAVSSLRHNLSPQILKEARTIRQGMVLVDRDGSPMRIFPGASHALVEINRLRGQGLDIQAAIASKTDVPEYARICLDNLVIDDGTVLKDCFQPHLVEISGGSKVRHIERLHRKTGIAYEDMCFFDNEQWNILDVSRGLPGVKCYYTPDGMSKKAWQLAKAEFGL